VPDAAIALDLVDTVYLMSVLSDHPRSIDRYIDYFGSGTSDLEPRGTEAGSAAEGAAVVVRRP
jgi:hypothetical protein